MDTPYVFVGVKTSQQFNEERRVESVVLVTESFKGKLEVGKQIALDTFSGTSCAAFLPDGVQLLIMASGDSLEVLHSSSCQIFAVESMQIDGKFHFPSEEIQSTVRALREAVNSEAK